MSSASAFKVNRRFIEGFDVSGDPVEKICISCEGIDFEVITFGATISSIRIGGQEVTVGHAGESAGLYKSNTNYMGCIAGRFANRICNGKFSLDGKDFQLAVNNGPNALHGGLVGFDKRNWTCDDIVLTESASESKAALVLSLYSADGEEGYPGHMNAQIVYEIDRIDNSLAIYKNAVCSNPSPINLTNHAYWNLSGGIRSIKQHTLWLNCDAYLPVNHVQIPTGVIQEVNGSHYDLTAPGGRSLGDVIPHIDGGGQPGLDHCFVINRAASSAPSEFFQLKPTDGSDTSMPLFHYRYNEGPYPKAHDVAILCDPTSGLSMRVSTTQPGLQVYTANFLPLTQSEPALSLMTQHNAVCLETQHFPDAINQPTFHSVVLRPDSLYRHCSRFKFSKQ